jgi:hypothetical protein
MASKKPLVVGPDGLPRQMQAGDVLDFVVLPGTEDNPWGGGEVDGYFYAGAFVANGWGLGYTVGLTINGFTDATDSGWVNDSSSFATRPATFNGASCNPTGTVVYATGVISGQARLFRSPDTGGTWTNVSQISSGASSACIACGGDDIIFAQHDTNSLAVSFNGGGSWSNTGLNACLSAASSVGIADDGITGIVINGGNVLKTTTDGFTTGTTISGGGIFQACAITRDGAFFVAGANTRHLYTNTTGADSFTEHTGSSLDSGQGFISMAVGGTSGQRYILFCSENSKLYLSSNGGASFAQITDVGTGTFYGLSVSHTGQYQTAVSASGGTTKVWQSDNFGLAGSWVAQNTGTFNGVSWGATCVGDTNIIGTSPPQYATTVHVFANDASKYPWTRTIVPGFGFDPATLTASALGDTATDSILTIGGVQYVGVPGLKIGSHTISLSANAVIGGTNTGDQDLRATWVTLTDGATPALDASAGDVFYLAAGGDRTIAVPTNSPASGKTKVIVIAHHAVSADRTVALNAGAGGFRLGAWAITATVSGKTDYITALWNAVDSFYDVTGIAKGYS